MTKVGSWVVAHATALDAAWTGLALVCLFGAAVLRFLDEPAWELMWGFAWGVAAGTLVVRAVTILARRHENKRRRYLPKSIDEMGVDDDGNRILSVVLVGGEVRTITMPGEYHPADDAGELLIRTACPELFQPGGAFYDAGFHFEGV